MIDRLTSLTIEDFRLFGGRHEFPLDADAVLIHGSNGTGKSSLLYAIEYALTGAVTDLKGYQGDYPRCLRHIHASTPTQITLNYRENGDDRLIHTTVPALPNDLAVHSGLSDEDAQFFLDRCYLSQVRLSRLLDLYQTVERGSSETPIVAFVKKLLNVTLLDNLSDGLKDLARIDRTRNSFPGYAALEGELNRLPVLQRQLSDDIKAAEDKQQSRLTGLSTHLTAIARSVNVDTWSLENAQALRSSLQADLDAGVADSTLRGLERAQSELRSMKLFLEARQESGIEVDLLQKDVLAIEKRLAELEYSLRVVVANIIETLTPQNDQGVLAPPLEELWAVAEATLHSSLADLRIALDNILSLEKSRTETDNALQIIQSRINELAERLTQESLGLPSSIDLLAAIATQVNSNECPVCTRDFSELGGESLKDFLSRRITDLGAKVQSVQALAAEREQLQVQYAEKKRFSAALTERQRKSPQLDATAARVSQLEGYQKQLKSVEELMFEWRTLTERSNSIKAQLQLFQTQQQEYLAAIIRLAELAKQLLVTIANYSNYRDAVDAQLRVCAAKIAEENAKVSSWRRAIDLLDEIISGFRRREDLNREWLKLDGQVRRFEKARDAVAGHIFSAKQLQKAARETKRKMVERVFTQRLNSLWTDLFERLVRNELFRPRLSEPEGWRDQIRAPIQAVHDNCEPFGNVGAIHSLGNLNTAALSLFLSLNLVEVPKNQVILLDDPVQSMDDIHVTQLGLLLRELIRQAKRQVVVAVHERSLFNFLSFELAPSVEGQKLITIDLHRRAEATQCTAEIKTVEWTPDRVSITEEPIQRVAS